MKGEIFITLIFIDQARGNIQINKLIGLSLCIL